MTAIGDASALVVSNGNSCAGSEDSMKALTAMALGLGVALSVSLVAQGPGERTWTGKISDSMCKEQHQAGEHDGKKMTDADCASVCIKKGAKYVFLSEGHVYQLANQSSKTIASHVGQEVKLTGALKADTITAKQIEPAAKPAK
jgi:hypothetical protein